ncbi:MAG: hypothetical protein SFW09_09930 [Hyphomicrobiaceae bacterium]|nr:hypothetical protein [Hyphomicrobiaceae bacterium]
MTVTIRRARSIMIRGAVVASLAGVAGCGGGLNDVEFNGKIFDAVGLTGALGKKAEPKTEARAPLVLPPSGQSLPAPGELTANAPPPPAATNEAWPQDPDQKKLASADAKKQQQDSYCQDGNWKKKAHKDEIGADEGPHGRCNSIFSFIGSSLFGD